MEYFRKLVNISIPSCSNFRITNYHGTTILDAAIATRQDKILPIRRPSPHRHQIPRTHSLQIFKDLAEMRASTSEVPSGSVAKRQQRKSIACVSGPPTSALLMSSVVADVIPTKSNAPEASPAPNVGMRGVLPSVYMSIGIGRSKFMKGRRIVPV